MSTQTTQIGAIRRLLATTSGGWVKVTSSALQAVRYDRKRMLLEVEFRTGKRYAYGSVPAALYRELLRAESKGRFFVKSVRNDFPMLRVRNI